MRLAMLGMALAVTLFASPGQAQISVKIGVMNDRGGTFADMAGEGSVRAAEMAVEDFTADHKDLKVEIISGDHQNKPDIGAAMARQWYDQNGVDVIVDVPTSSVALAVHQVTREKNKVLLATGPAVQDLTGAQCSPNTVHWVYDTWSLANGTAREVVRRGGKEWFFLTADYTFGHMLEAEATKVIEAGGGRVLGAARHPFVTSDFSSFLLQAQSSGAKIVGLANSGADAVNSIKQAAEFGIVPGGQTLAAMLLMVTDIKALGLETAQGLVLTGAFYWNLNDDTREWSRRFAARNNGKMPTQIQAGVYSSIIHYLKAVEALKSKDSGAAVVAKMKEIPTDDPLFGHGTIRPDGRKLHPLYLFEVKKPSDSKEEWDVYNVLSTIPAEEAFRPMSEGGCPLVEKTVAQGAKE